MYNRKLLGKRIKELRKSRGLTQDALAETVGIDSKHLSRIECGVNFPSLDLLCKIADVLKVEPFVLFQTMHLKNKSELIYAINNILESQPEEKLRIFYRLLIDIAL